MPAHVPRRRFAPSFVITFAALPLACGAPDAKPVEAPSTPTASSASSTTADSIATPSAAPDSAPTPAITTTASTTPPVAANKWTLMRATDDTCQVMPEIECASTPCLSPAKPYACPAAVTRYPTKIDRKDGKCTVTFNERAIICKQPDATCNPPPPKYKTVKVDCPAP